VFLIEGRARPDHAPSYQGGFRMTAISQSFGDVTRIENPDPNQYGKFEEIASIRGATERAATSLEGRYAMDLISDLLRLARKNCAVDIQLHIGECTDPTDFNTFEKILVLEEALLTTWNTDDLGVLESGDETVVNENADLSARDLYEIMPITLGEKAAGEVTNEILDITIGDSPTCGECEGEVETDGCFKIYAISSAAGGSPGTPGDVIYSIDKGTTWFAHDIDTLGAAEAPSGVAVVGSYVVVVSNASASQHYAAKSEFDTVSDPAFTEVATGYVASGEPNATWSVGNKAFVVGDGGYVYLIEDATAGVSVLDAGSATVDDLLDVHALSASKMVAVGNNGAVIYTTNGTTFTAATRPVGVGVHLNCVWMKSDSVWMVGTSAGSLYYTLNSGVTWTAKGFPGAGTGVVRDIAFSTDAVGWLAHDTTTPAGRILRTYDGGQQWQVIPEQTGTIPANDHITALAACSLDPNFVVAGGLADNGTDGIVVTGSAPSAI
jgi:photosystem II stability/assembly factor-like uncharacterized protein